MRTRQQKTERLQAFLHTFFPANESTGEKLVNGWLLVKWQPEKGASRVELYSHPLNNPHGRF